MEEEKEVNENEGNPPKRNQELLQILQDNALTILKKEIQKVIFHIPFFIPLI